MKELTLARKIGVRSGVLETPKFTVSRRSVLSSKFLETKRGKIKSFSHASSYRLRQRLACYTVPNSKLYSACLTLPCHRFVSCEEYRAFWKYFQIYIRSDSVLSRCGFVWRHELQANGYKKPHTHFIIYIPNDISDSDFYFRFASICEKLIIRFDFCEKSQDYFRVFGLDFQMVQESGKYIKYLLDHLSKHKQVQLGFIGRQWGVINSKIFVEVKLNDLIEEECRIMSVRSNPAMVRKICLTFSRSLRRYFSWRYQRGDSPFGFCLRRVRGLPRFVFLSDSAVSRFRKYVNFLIHEYF